MVEIEIAGGNNESLFFFPLKRTLRGRLDLTRINHAKAFEMHQKIGVLPGVIVGFDADKGVAYVRDRLHDAEYAELRNKLEAAGHRLGPAREEYSGVHCATWAHWIRRAVEDQKAEIVTGKLPEVDGEPQVELTPRTRSRDEQIDRLINVVEKLLSGKLAKV